jgi:hypothetical protein
MKLNLNCAEEEAFAYECFKHALSFTSSDCSSKLILHIFDEKFSSARTTNETIVTNVLGPLSKELLFKDLCEVNFVSSDACNRKSENLISILFRFFLSRERCQYYITLSGG